MIAAQPAQPIRTRSTRLAILAQNSRTAQQRCADWDWSDDLSHLSTAKRASWCRILSSVATVEKLGAFAQERGHTLVELAFSWLASQPFVASVIAGATRPEQVASNAKAAGWELTKEDFAAVAEIVGQNVPA